MAEEKNRDFTIGATLDQDTIIPNMHLLNEMDPKHMRKQMELKQTHH